MLYTDLHVIISKLLIFLVGIVKTPKFTKLDILGFGLGQFKTILQGPLLNFIETLLKLTFDRMNMFRFVTDQRVLNI